MTSGRKSTLPLHPVRPLRVFAFEPSFAWRPDLSVLNETGWRFRGRRCALGRWGSTWRWSPSIQPATVATSRSISITRTGWEGFEAIVTETDFYLQLDVERGQ